MFRPAIHTCLLLAAALATTTPGCSPPADPRGGDNAVRGDNAAQSARSYTVRGVVRQLPDPADPSAQLLIRHEAVPDFVDVDGQQTGMPAMTMPFTPPADLSLEGIEIGDSVELTFTVDWNASPAMELTALRKLPEGA
jgi:Cu/Ag efflux protein CusF